MSTKFLFVAALLFALAWSENLSVDQVLESENTHTSEINQNFVNSDVSENDQANENAVSVTEKDEINLSDLLFEYLDLSKNFKNDEKDSSETG